MIHVRENGEISINELHRKIGGNRNTLTETHKQLVQDGHLEIIQRGNRKFLTFKVTDFDKYFEHFHWQIEFDIDLAFREILALRQYKPICKIHEQSENRMSYWTNPKARPHLEAIAERINWIYARTASLTYAEVLGLIPKKFSSTIKQHNKECIDTMKKIIEKLVNEHEESESAIRNMMSWNIYGYKLLHQLESISKKPSLKSKRSR